MLLVFAKKKIANNHLQGPIISVPTNKLIFLFIILYSEDVDVSMDFLEYLIKEVYYTINCYDIKP